MIAYMILTECLWKFQWRIALWDCCEHALFFIYQELKKSSLHCNRLRFRNSDCTHDIWHWHRVATFYWNLKKVTYVDKWNMNGGISHETRIIIKVVNELNVYREYAVEWLHYTLVAGRPCCLRPQRAEGGCHNSSFKLTDMPLRTF